MASLAVRHRETNHFNCANPNEVYLADAGKGVSIAVFGLREEHRYPLECTMGFLILSNGVPVGYGGTSALCRQANTGINIFDEYRGSEAPYLWIQVMRVVSQPLRLHAVHNEPVSVRIREFRSARKRRFLVPLSRRLQAGLAGDESSGETRMATPAARQWLS